MQGIVEVLFAGVRKEQPNDNREDDRIGMANQANALASCFQIEVDRAYQGGGRYA